MHFDTNISAVKATSSDIAVSAVILPLHVVLLDQPIDVLLDVCHSQHASAHGRLDDLGYQLTMSNGLPRLHDANYGSLAFKIAVLGHTHVRLLVLLLGLFELNLVDLDAVLCVREFGIDCESVRRVDVAAFRILRQWPKLRAGERLQCTFDFRFGCTKLTKLCREVREHTKDLRKPVSDRM